MSLRSCADLTVNTANAIVSWFEKRSLDKVLKLELVQFGIMVANLAPVIAGQLVRAFN